MTWRKHIRTSTLIIELTKKINRPKTEDGDGQIPVFHPLSPVYLHMELTYGRKI